jgi:hypothetical protein
MKRAGVFVIVSIAAALAGVAFACGSNPIPIARVLSIRCEISDAGDGGTSCPAGQFCSTTSCGPGAGSCEVIRSADCGVSGYECGCDGISYRNSCDRQVAGVGRAGPGQCAGQSGVPPIGFGCTPGSATSSCPKNTVCANVATFPLPQLLKEELLKEDPSMFRTNCMDLVQATTQGSSFPLFPTVCWATPDCSVLGSRVLGVCDQQCISDCSAISDGGVYFACPDASAAP